MNIQRDDKGWYCSLTKERLSEDAVMSREIALERQRPKPFELKRKVVVDRDWLKTAIGHEAYEQALRDRNVIMLDSWL